MDEKTILAYNQMAKRYDEETVDFWNRFPRTFLDKFIEITQGKVIDIGSGPGRDALLLKEKGFEVICLDAAEAMIAICKEKELQSVLGDFISMPFEDASFNGAWAYTSLLHVSKADLPKALNEIRRVLKERGILGLGLIEGDIEEYRESSGANTLRWFSFYKKKEIQKILEFCGFEIIYFEQFKPGLKNYLNFIARKK